MISIATGSLVSTIFVAIVLLASSASASGNFVSWRQDVDFRANIDRLNCTVQSFFPCSPTWQERFNCAKWLTYRNFWEAAGSPAPDDIPRLDHFPHCKADPECMMYIHYGWSQSFGPLDCNCDSKFDYTDRLAIILIKGQECNDQYILRLDIVQRYNECARELHVPDVEMITKTCPVEKVPEKKESDNTID